MRPSIINKAYARSLGLFAAIMCGLVSLSASAETTSEWRSFSWKYETDIEVGGCYSFTISIQNDGTYLAYPCANKNEPSSNGKISQPELDELNRIATAITLENLNYTFCCEDTD